MVDAATLHSQIVAALARGATILVPSQRAAQSLARDHVPSRELSPEQPAILTWRAWTSRLWHQALLTGKAGQLLLNRTQEAALWRGLIAREPAVSSLGDPASLARLAADAFGALAHHRGLDRLPGSATNTDTETFARLASAFQQICRREDYLPQTRLESALQRIVLERKVGADATDLVLHGFDQLLPAQRALLDAFDQIGVPVTILPSLDLAGDRRLFAAQDESEELLEAARWCRAILDRQPSARIAVLVPGLDENGSATLIDRIFRKILRPAAQAIGAPVDTLPYHIASGSPLAETPHAAGALDLLAWTLAPLPLDRVSALLLSPFLAGRELVARAEFDAFELRPSPVLRPEIELDWLLTHMERSARRERLEPLLAGLHSMRAFARKRLSRDERRSWGEWAEFVRELLSAIGWAGQPPADAAELEARRAWESALDELATLDFDGTRVTWEQSVTTLRRLAANTLLPAPLRDAPVQVMTPTDAAAANFDAIWFLRAGDLAWPSPPASNPLLGWPLRRELGMPGSDPGADQAHARQVTGRIAASAATVVFSYAQEVAEGRQRVSPALHGLNLRVRATDAAAGNDPPPIGLAASPDDSPIPPPPDRPVHGGAAVLRAQAACGFRAFAEWRLFASELDAREPGLNLRERGIAVHHVLEHFWEKVGTQAALHLMPDEERDARLAESVDEALAKVSKTAKTAWHHAYLETQRKRLVTLGKRWLTIEADRPIPFTVDRRESETRDARIGPLHLTLRVDRVDRTSYGAVLVDYKTGNATASDWLSDRPAEPQLPLYAVLAQEPLHAIAFGKVRPGKKMELTGYEDRPGTLTRPVKLDAESLQTHIEEWEATLSRLATGFWNGEAQVSPKQFPTTCRYCAQRLLCRLDSSSLIDDDEEDELDEDDLRQGELPG